MRQHAKTCRSPILTGLTVAAALALAAGHAFGQTSGSSAGTGSSGSGTSGKTTGSSGSSSGKSGSGSKSHTNANAKKSAAPKSTGAKPLVTGGTTLSDMARASGDAKSDPAKPEGDGAKKEGSAESGVKVSDYMTVDIFVQDEDLSNVLQMLSLQSRKNIIASKDVSASVTANLYGVTFYEALDSVLNVNGYGYIEKGNFIYVHTLDEIAQIQAAERKQVTKVIRLNYLNANDAAEFVTPLLSDSGQIKTNGDVGDFNLPDKTPYGNEQYALSAMLVIFDYPDHIAEVEELLKQIDTKPAQVLVEATILQTSLNESNAFGVDFSVLHDVNFLDFLGLGGPLGSAGALGQTGADKFAPKDNEGSAISSTAGNFGGPSTIKAAILADQVGVFIRALDEVGNVTILSNPKILALNRQPAKVLVGRKLGYLNTTATETSTTQTVEFLDTGTQLSFRPFVSNDGMVRMELKPRVSEGVIRTASDAKGSAVTIPDEITQEITTNVIVPDGSTIVLGGLFKETTKLNRSQVPVLGDIPILGLAFQGHDDSTDRAEIIFMIKPTVVHEKVLLDQGERAVAHADRLRSGSREGLLPFSRERQTAQLNLEAERLLAEGKTDEAMWKLSRSLALNPVQTDAIRLKEQAQAKRDTWPAGSILEHVIGGENGIAPATPAHTKPAADAAPVSPAPAPSPTAPAASTAMVGPQEPSIMQATPAQPTAQAGPTTVQAQASSGSSPTEAPVSEQQGTQRSPSVLAALADMLTNQPAPAPAGTSQPQASQPAAASPTSAQPAATTTAQAPELPKFQSTEALAQAFALGATPSLFHIPPYFQLMVSGLNWSDPCSPAMQTAEAPAQNFDEAVTAMPVEPPQPAEPHLPAPANQPN